MMINCYNCKKDCGTCNRNGCPNYTFNSENKAVYTNKNCTRFCKHNQDGKCELLLCTYGVVVGQESTEDEKLQDLVGEVYHLNEDTPDGVIIDADTILADTMEQADFYENGIATELFEVYRDSSDQESLRKVFSLFTGLSFEEFLRICQKEITRKEMEDSRRAS